MINQEALAEAKKRGLIPEEQIPEEQIINTDEKNLKEEALAEAKKRGLINTETEVSYWGGVPTEVPKGKPILESGVIGEARDVKSKLSNIEFAYSDLVKSTKAIVGDKEASTNLQKKQDKLNTEIVSILKSRGIESYYNKGKLLVVKKNKEGKEELIDLNEDTFRNIIEDMGSSAGEIGGGIMGALGGATAGASIGMTPQTKAIGGIVGGLIGGYTGVTAGKVTDIIRNSLALNRKIDAKKTLAKGLEAGAADVYMTGGAGVVAKTFAPLGGVAGRLKTLLKEGDIVGAKKIIKSDYGVTDKQIDEHFDAIKKDVSGWEDLRGDDLTRAKLLAVVQQQPQGKPLIVQAIKNNPKAAIETSKEIEFRAKKLNQAAKQFSRDPSKIKKSIEAYEKVVKKNYQEVRQLIDDAVPNFKPEIDKKTFSETLKELNTRIIDPTVKEKVSNLANSIVQQKTNTIGDVIELRQLFNKFYGKNKRYFESKTDKETLFSIQKEIDKKINEAIESVNNPEISKALKTAFADAKYKYSSMFKAQDTATYNAIFKKGASEDDIGKALLKYSKATDNDLETVLSKLSPNQRVKAEFSILKKMISNASSKKEAEAVDFSKLAEDIGTSKKIFKSPEAKQFLKNIEGYEQKFGKDIDIQSIAAGVSQKQEKNIATGLVGKIMMKISSLRFEALQRLIPTEGGRRLSLQKSIESALETARTPKEFFFNVQKIKGLPNKDRIALKKNIEEINNIEKEIRANQKIKGQPKNEEAIKTKKLTKEEFLRLKEERRKDKK